MGQLALTVGGGIVGSLFGAPQWGMLAGSVLGSLLFGPPDQKQEGPRLQDLSVTSSAYGSTIPFLYGTARLGGNLIWSSGIREVSATKRQGGKGGGGGVRTKTYSYYSSFAIALCAGPVTDILKIWADGKIIFNKTGTGVVAKNGYVFRFYQGTEDQVPDPAIVSWVAQNVTLAPNACPAYRGLSYIVFDNLPLEDFGNRVPNITVELTGPMNDSKAPVTTLTPLAGSSLPENNGQGTIDWDTQRYVVAVDGGLKVYDLVVNQQSREVASADILEGRPGAISRDSTIHYGSDQYIYIGGTESFQGNAIYKVEANSMKIHGTFGEHRLILHNEEDCFVTPTFIHRVAVQGIDGQTYTYVVCSGHGAWGVLNGSMEYVAGAYASSPQMHWDYVVDQNALIPGPERADGTGSDVYFLNYTALQNVAYLYRLRIGQDFDGFGGTSTSISFDELGSFALSTMAPGQTVWDLSEAWYDHSDDTIIFRVRDYLTKWDLTTWSARWQKQITPVSGNAGANSSRITSGRLGLVDWDRKFYEISTADGAIISVVDGEIDIANNYTNRAFDGRTSSIVTHGPQGALRVYIGRGAANSVALADVITDVCAKGGLDDTQIDVSEITQHLRGYVVSRNAAPKDVLYQLMQAFFFDVIERDSKLHFVPKGTSSVVTIPQEDLATEGGREEDGMFWVQTRAQEQELPVAVNLKFININLDYQNGEAHARRVTGPYRTMHSKKNMDLEMPVVFSDEEAFQLSEALLYSLWQERDSFKTRLGWQYLWLDPGDALSVTMENGDAYGVRVSSMDVGADYSIKMVMASEDADTYASDAPGARMTFVTPVIQDTVTGRMFLLNIPYLRDVDVTNAGTRVYYAAGAFRDGWPGGAIVRSIDGGFTFDDITSVPLTTTWGTVINTLSDTPTPFATDTVNEIHLAISNQTLALESITTEALLAGGNACLIGDEIVQFRDVTVNDDGTYTLSHLLRGQRGTEWACGTHAPGDIFVFLDPSVVGALTYDTSEVGVTRQYKLVPFGRYVNDMPSQVFKPLARDLMPYAPVNFDRVDTPLVGSTITWERRTRYGGALTDGTGTVPLNEPTEAYAVYIISSSQDPYDVDPNNPSTYIRAYTGLTTPECTYTETDQMTDGFDYSDTLYAAVFQIGKLGPGFCGPAILPPPP